MAPKGAAPPNQANAIFLFAGENDWPRRARPLGKVRAGPMPWKTREKMKRMGEEKTARPAIMDHNEYHATPMTKSLLLPNSSPKRPPMRMKVPMVKL